jgi:D-apionate oxidoisomerase
MTVITILGAGGKMGNRVTQPLLDTKKYELRFVEKSEAGQARIREAGNTVMELDDALKGTDVVIFTTPDALVRQISDEVVPKLDPGTKILFLGPCSNRGRSR